MNPITTTLTSHLTLTLVCEKLPSLPICPLFFIYFVRREDNYLNLLAQIMLRASYCALIFAPIVKFAGKLNAEPLLACLMFFKN